MGVVLWIDLKRGIKRSSFPLAVAGMALGGVLGMSAIYEERKLNGHLGGGMVFFHLAQKGSSSLIYLYLIPLLVVIPFSSALRDDMKSGFRILMLPRCGLKSYLGSKLLASYLIGALIVAASTLLLYLGCYCAFPPGEFEIQDFRMYSAAYFRIAGEYLLLGMLNGGLWSLAGTVFAVLLEDKFVGLGAPFIIYYIFVSFQKRYYANLSYLNPQEWASPFTTNGWIDFLLLAGLGMLAGVLSFQYLKRRLL